jgi:hypothetical protein
MGLSAQRPCRAWKSCANGRASKKPSATCAPSAISLSYLSASTASKVRAPRTTVNGQESTVLIPIDVGGGPASPVRQISAPGHPGELS